MHRIVAFRGCQIVRVASLERLELEHRARLDLGQLIQALQLLLVQLQEVRHLLADRREVVLVVEATLYLRGNKVAEAGRHLVDVIHISAAFPKGQLQASVPTQEFSRTENWCETHWKSIV